MTQSNSAARLPVSLLLYVMWVAITLLGGRWMAGGKEQPLAELVKHSIAWNILAASALIVAAAWVFRWHDLKLEAPKPWGSLRLLWLPALYILAFLGISIAMGPVPASITGFLLVNTFIVGLSEELMFRGVMFQALRTRIPLWPAMILTSVLFGSVHVLNVFLTGELVTSAIQAVAATMSGLVFMAILVRTGSIWPAIIYHALWDFGTFWMMSHGSGAASPPQSGALALAAPVLLVLPNFLYALYLLRNVRNDTLLSTEVSHTRAVPA